MPDAITIPALQLAEVPEALRRWCAANEGSEAIAAWVAWTETPDCGNWGSSLIDRAQGNTEVTELRSGRRVTAERAEWAASLPHGDGEGAAGTEARADEAPTLTLLDVPELLRQWCGLSKVNAAVPVWREWMKRPEFAAWFALTHEPGHVTVCHSPTDRRVRASEAAWAASAPRVGHWCCVEGDTNDEAHELWRCGCDTHNLMTRGQMLCDDCDYHEPPPCGHSPQVATAAAPEDPRGVAGREIAATGGVKHDRDKPRYDLLPFRALADVVGVLTYGAKKYAPENWRKVDGWRWRYYGAALRHMVAWWGGEKVDSESGKPHLAHAICCLMFAAELDGEVSRG